MSAGDIVSHVMDKGIRTIFVVPCLEYQEKAASSTSCNLIKLQTLSSNIFKATA